MQFINVAYLISDGEQSVDEYGEASVTNDRRKVYVSEKSVKQSEFYQAQAAGFKPEVTLEIRKIEYKNEQSIEYNGSEYKVLRVYDKGDGIVEVVMYKGINDGNS